MATYFKALVRMERKPESNWEVNFAGNNFAYGVDEQIEGKGKAIKSLKHKETISTILGVTNQHYLNGR